MFAGYRHCKKCGKALMGLFDGALCEECEKEENSQMTNEEAIRCLSVHSSTNGSGLCTDEQHYEAKQIAIKALEQQPCDDAISRQAVLDGLASIAKAKAKSDAQKALMGRVMFFTEQLPPVTPQQKYGKWIALVTRPMTNEEREYYSEQLDYCDGDAVIYNCPLPEEGQDVLITTCTGAVLIDTFFKDYDGCGFEGYDIEDVKAWMPLPKPYEPQESEDKE